MYKSAEDLTKRRCPVAYIDLEPFKGHHYPDVLLSVLLAANLRFYRWISEETRLSEPSLKERIMFWRKNGSVARKEKILTTLHNLIAELETQLHLTDGAKLEDRSSTRADRNQGISAGSKTHFPALSDTSVEVNISRSLETSRERAINENYTRSKQDWLHRKIINLQHIFRELSEIAQNDSFIFLDDLYHIHRSDQASLLDYFHRIAKGNSLWLKIGTIKNRSNWYLDSPQPTGLKIGDDADEINLDITLEQFSSSREFLRNILRRYIEESSAPCLEDLVADGGFDRLVLASGGVARDFLGLFRRSIDTTKERLTRNQSHPRGNKVGAEDVNIASGNYGESKKEEFRRDTLEDRQNLETALTKIRKFCVEKTKQNTFLIDQDARDTETIRVQELIDLRLIHHVKSRVTIPDRPGKIYRALLLDISQYSGERARRDVSIIEFWREGARESLRKTSLIYDPGVTIEQLDAEIIQIAEKKRVQSDEFQIPLGFETTDPNENEEPPERTCH